MKGHAEVIAAEVERMVAGWDGELTIDLLDFFAELTIYTSSACLIGKKFREQLDGRFAALYHDLERGTDALAYVDAVRADRELPSARRGPGRAGRSWSRAIMAGRRRRRPPAGDDATCSTC